MVAVKLMQNWHNLKMMLFMRLLKTRIKVMKKLLGSLLLGARQLVATFNRYRDDHGIAITKKLFDEGSDEFHKAANLAVSCINDHKKYCQKVLCNAMEHVGTDEDALTRVIVTRAEKDLKEIKEMYYKRNIVHLEHVAAKETS